MHGQFCHCYVIHWYLDPLEIALLDGYWGWLKSVVYKMTQWSTNSTSWAVNVALSIAQEPLPANWAISGWWTFCCMIADKTPHELRIWLISIYYVIFWVNHEPLFLLSLDLEATRWVCRIHKHECKSDFISYVVTSSVTSSKPTRTAGCVLIPGRNMISRVY